MPMVELFLKNILSNIVFFKKKSLSKDITKPLGRFLLVNRCQLLR